MISSALLVYVIDLKLPLDLINGNVNMSLVRW